MAQFYLFTPAILLQIIVTLIFIDSKIEVDAYIPRFSHGRPKGGLVGIPGNRHHDSSYNTEVLENPPPGAWFEQKLDHFNGANSATWKQKYFTNETFYNGTGPLFVMIGGEGKANPIWMVKGAWLEYAKKYGAYCVMLEHRFYGDSHPTPDMSVESLQYLSSEQALADLAAFITMHTRKFGFRKVIVFGGSYPGSLAAWFRMKYPHIAHGAVATSAPLLAKVDFLEYFEVVDASLKTFGNSDACNVAVNSAVKKVEEMIQTYEGRKELKTMFQLCDYIDPNVAKDVKNLFSTLAGNFAGVVQYNKDNRAFEGATDSNITIDTLCGIMTDASTPTALERYAKVNSLMMKVYSAKCQDFKYDKMIDELRQTKWSSSAAEGGRQWTYQTCTEFAFYQSSDSNGQPFGHGFPIDFWLEQCADIFGPTINSTLIRAAVERSNEDYGALGVRISRVVFPNGSIDPWHALGVVEDIGPDAKAIFINGTAHCANMYPASPDDLPGLTAARVQIQDSIGRWLSD